MMRLVTRAQWGASPQKATKRTHPIGKTHGVTLHWEGPHMGKFAHSACASKVRGIEKFHEQTRGWADLAYNALVCPHGYVFEGRGPGVQSAANGNSDTNDDWYAVCYLGGEGDGFTDEGKQGFVDAVRWLRDKGAAGPKVNGHRDHKATTCPGDEIYRWLKTADFDNQEDEMNKPQEDKLDAALAWAKSARAQSLAAHTVALRVEVKMEALIEALEKSGKIEPLDNDAIAERVADELAERLKGEG